jgi:exonuclease-1
MYYAMQVLKQEKVDYIVAPYEADAQMAFLSVNKLVDAVITEDSDLIPFGCSRVSAFLQPFPLPSTSSIIFLFTTLVSCLLPLRTLVVFFSFYVSHCNVQIIFKMDKFGQGVEFQITRLEQNSELDLHGFTKQMLLEMCILSGCDYLPSLLGMGVKRAHALIQKLKSHEKVNHVFSVFIEHLSILPPLYHKKPGITCGIAVIQDKVDQRTHIHYAHAE